MDVARPAEAVDHVLETSSAPAPGILIEVACWPDPPLASMAWLEVDMKK